MLKISGLSVAYGGLHALEDVSLEVAEGEFVTIVGPNGAGKTTLINAIAGLHPATSGRITMDGCEMTSLPPHRFCAAGVAIVPEGRRLFTRMTVRENLEIGGYVRAARATRKQSLDGVCALFPAVRDKLDAQVMCRRLSEYVAGHRKGAERGAHSIG